MATKRVTLDAAPFAAYLRHIMRRDETSRKVTARNLEIEERQFGRIVDGETKSVPVGVADRVLTADGTHLREIYPDWYEVAA